MLFHTLYGYVVQDEGKGLWFLFLLRERLISNIKCPTLLIWGDKDTATPLEDAKTIEKLIPDAGLCVIKNTGHYSFCERPYEAHAILQSFIK